MRPLLVVVADELGQGRQQVPLVQDDDVVKTLSAERPNHFLDDRVRTRRSNGRGDAINTDPLGTLAKVAPVDGISIPQQMAWLASPGCRLDDLSPHPSGRRAGGHIDMHQLASAMRDEHQHVQRLERQSRHREQIRGPQVMSVVGQEVRQVWLGERTGPRQR